MRQELILLALCSLSARVPAGAEATRIAADELLRAAKDVAAASNRSSREPTP
jgi:hypothetical protein